MKPIPVVGKEGGSQQTGAGFVNVTDPNLQNLGKTIGDLAAQKKLQIVVPTQGQTLGTIKPTNQPMSGQQVQPNQAGVTGQPQVGQMQMKEKDEGKPGKNFAKIAKGAAKRYGSKEAGERVAGAVRAKLAKQGKLEEEQIDELSRTTVRNYVKKAEADLDTSRRMMAAAAKRKGIPVDQEYESPSASGMFKRQMKRYRGLDDADYKLNPDGRQVPVKIPANEGAKVDRMVKHIEKSARDLGKSKDKAEDIAWATANKRGMLDNKNKKKMKEADIPSTQGIDTKGAGLGAGRSMTTLEAKEPQVEVIDNAFNRENYKDLIGKKYPKSKAPAYARVKEISEGAKPDFLDLDKDGNKKEPMKKAAADKKKQKVKESMNHRISAARLEGKSHGLKGHAHCGKSFEDLEERKAYCEGYKEGLDECYGMGVYEDSMPATLGGMADQAMDEASMVTPQVAADYIGKRQQQGAQGFKNSGLKAPNWDVRSQIGKRAFNRAGIEMGEGEMEEGNAFTAALARTPKGGKFKVGGKSFTDHSNYDSSLDEYAFESWNKQLKDLINEGISVSVSKGLEGGHDSATVTATDGDSDKLMALVKSAGLGVFGAEETNNDYGSATGSPEHGGIKVVGDHDGMMGIMKKLAGVEKNGTDDYAGEEGCGCESEDGAVEESTCNECGMMEGQCKCHEGNEMVDEMESEDQMTYKMAEEAGVQTDAQADEEDESKEDQALATSDKAEDEEDELEESFAFESLLRKLNGLHESKEDEKVCKHCKKNPCECDDEEDVTEDLNEWANQIGKDKAGKGTDAQFEQDMDFMTKVISGGLNKLKSTGQTTIPVIAGQENRTYNGPVDWATLAGIKKA